MNKYMLMGCIFLLNLSASLSPAEEECKPKGTLIDLSVEVARPALNDLARATAYFEAQGANPAELAKRINTAITAALETAKTHKQVKTRSGNTHTSPHYNKDGRIGGWRIRSEILLESQAIMELSELLGTLQESGLVIGQIMLLPSPETEKKAETEATLEAIAAFEAKAAMVAGVLKKSYRIRQMNIGKVGQPAVLPIMRTSKMAAVEAAPAPIEAGESLVTVTVSGQIELPLE